MNRRLEIGIVAAAEAGGALLACGAVALMVRLTWCLYASGDLDARWFGPEGAVVPIAHQHGPLIGALLVLAHALRFVWFARSKREAPDRWFLWAMVAVAEALLVCFAFFWTVTVVVANTGGHPF